MYLVSAPMSWNPSANDGRIKYFQSNPALSGPYPEVGSQSSRTANSRISISPTQKLGAATPNSDAAEMMLSRRLYGRSPARIPSGMDTTSPTAIADSVRGIVLLNFSQTRGATGWSEA